jgi:hypothetical protein
MKMQSLILPTNRFYYFFNTSLHNLKWWVWKRLWNGYGGNGRMNTMDQTRTPQNRKKFC